MIYNMFFRYLLKHLLCLKFHTLCILVEMKISQYKTLVNCSNCLLDKNLREQ